MSGNELFGVPVADGSIDIVDIRQERVNRAIGPVAGMLGALLAMEALRYLTGLTAPVAAGRYQLVDFAAGGRMSDDPWQSDPVSRSALPHPAGKIALSRDPGERGHRAGATQ